MKLAHFPYIAVLGIFIGFVVLVVLTRPQPPEPPIQYLNMTSESRIAPNKDVFVPGETLIYTPELKVTQEGWTDFLRTYWDETRSVSAKLCDGREAPQEKFSRNLPLGIVGDARGGRQVRVSIPRMPPGDYIRQSTAVRPATGAQAYYEVHFRIETPCPHG